MYLDSGIKLDQETKSSISRCSPGGNTKNCKQNRSRSLGEKVEVE